MEYVDVAHKIITGPWDVITWVIALMLGVSIIAILYRLVIGRAWDGGYSGKIQSTEESNTYNFFEYDRINRIHENYWNGRH